MSWVDFRKTNDTTRLKMKLRDPETLSRAIEADGSKSGMVLVLRRDFPGCLDHLPDVRPGKAAAHFIWSTKT